MCNRRVIVYHQQPVCRQYYAAPAPPPPPVQYYYAVPCPPPPPVVYRCQPVKQAQADYTWPDFLSLVLGGRKYADVIPEIRRGLPLTRPLDTAEIGLQEHSAPLSVSQALRGIKLCSKVGTSEFNRVVTFSVPEGTRVINLDAVRFEYDGTAHKWRSSDTFNNGDSHASRLSNVYEVHVRRRNGKDEYTIALTKNFVGGLRIKVDGKTFLVLTHQDPPRPPAPVVKNTKEPKVREQPLPSPRKETRLALAPAALEAPPIVSQEAAGSASLTPAPSPGTGVSEAVVERPAVKGKSSALPPLRLAAAPTGSVSGPEALSSALLGLNIPFSPGSASFAQMLLPDAPGTFPFSSPAPSPAHPIVRAPLTDPDKRQERQPALTTQLLPAELPQPPLQPAVVSSQPTAHSSLPLVPDREAAATARLAVARIQLPLSRPATEDQPKGGHGSLQPAQLPLQPDMLRKDDAPRPLIAQLAGLAPGLSPEEPRPVYRAPDLSLSPYREAVELRFDRDREQRRAALGSFSMHILISARKDFFIPYEYYRKLPEDRIKELTDFSNTVYGHAYNPPDGAFGSVFGLLPPDKKGKPSDTQKEEMRRAYSLLLSALNGDKPISEDAVSINPYGSGERARLTELYLRRRGAWHLARKPESDRDTTGRQDVEDLNTFARRMRGVVPYLESNLEYVRRRAVSELGKDAGVPREAPYRAKSGYHRDVEALRDSLQRVFSPSANLFSAELGIVGIKRFSDWRVWQFTAADVKAMETLVSRAKAAHETMPVPSRYSLDYFRYQRTGAALRQAEQYVGQVREGRQALVVADATDLSCYRFLLLAPNVSILSTARDEIPADQKLDEKEKRLREALLQIDRECALLKTLEGPYAQSRLEQLEQRRKDFHTFVERVNPELLRGRPQLLALLRTPQKVAPARLGVDPETAQQLEDFANSLRDIGPAFRRILK